MYAFVLCVCAFFKFSSIIIYIQYMYMVLLSICFVWCLWRPNAHDLVDVCACVPIVFFIFPFVVLYQFSYASHTTFYLQRFRLLIITVYVCVSICIRHCDRFGFERNIRKWFLGKHQNIRWYSKCLLVCVVWISRTIKCITPPSRQYNIYIRRPPPKKIHQNNKIRLISTQQREHGKKNRMNDFHTHTHKHTHTRTALSLSVCLACGFHIKRFMLYKHLFITCRSLYSALTVCHPNQIPIDCVTVTFFFNR